MTTQPEALRLADDLAKYLGGNTATKAAAELRRLSEIETLYLAAMRGRHAMSEELLALTAQRDALLEALKLALSSHGVMLMSDPPQDAWKVNRVEERARAAIAKAEGEKE